jgi:S1-C subfamily serine protease
VHDHDWWDEHAPLIGDHPSGIGYPAFDTGAWELPHPLPGGRGGADPGDPYEGAGYTQIMFEDTRARPRRFGVVLAGLVGAAAALGGAWALGAFDDPPPAEVVAQTAPVVRPTINVTGDTNELAVAVAAKVTPSIVSVEVGDGGFETDFVPLVSGSGVVIDDRLIVTNHHVVAEGDTVRVILQDGAIYEATLLGSDDETDLAVLEVDVAGLLPVALGDTGELTIGETAIAIGNPLGLSGGASLTVGVLSAFGRQIDTGADSSLFGMLQTDAPITEGSSGGALVDGSGNLIGITTAIGVSSAGAEGIGFAVPVELMERITAEIVETGRVRHAYLGVDLRNQLSERADGALVPTGAFVAAFPQEGDSAARAAGMRRGDVIVALNGRSVTTREALISDLRMLSAGDVATIGVDRNGDLIEFEIELAQRPVSP